MKRQNTQIHLVGTLIQLRSVTSRRVRTASALATCCILVLACGMVHADGKKGIGNWACDPKVNAALHVTWWYDWWLTAKAQIPGSEFVPQAWTYTDNDNSKFSDLLFQGIAQNKARYVLGYNEPDGSGAGHMTVAKALEGWPLLMKTGLPLGSPAAVHDDDAWMKAFMAGAAAKHYRVDFVCIHWYYLNARYLLDYVDKIHKLYGKPIWITEFCPVDWTGNGAITQRKAAEFVRQALPALNARSYVQRYAWYSDPGMPYGPGCLFNKNGSLTIVGKAYSEEPPGSFTTGPIAPK